MIGVILAGGKSTRMGRNKALISFRGRPLIGYIASAMQVAMKHIVISANSSSDYSFLRVPIVPDVYPDRGPLAGIQAALRYAKGDSIFVTSCDTPFVSVPLIRHLIGSSANVSACIAAVGEQIHPTLGIYHTGCLETAEFHLSTNRLKMLDFLKSIAAARIPITPALPFYSPFMLLNINSEEDLRHAESTVPLAFTSLPHDHRPSV